MRILERLIYIMDIIQQKEILKRVLKNQVQRFFNKMYIF